MTLGSMTGAAKDAVDEARAAGEKVGPHKLKTFSPFPIDALPRPARRACARCGRPLGQLPLELRADVPGDLGVLYRLGRRVPRRASSAASPAPTSPSPPSTASSPRRAPCSSGWPPTSRVAERERLSARDRGNHHAHHRLPDRRQQPRCARGDQRDPHARRRRLHHRRHPRPASPLPPTVLPHVVSGARRPSASIRATTRSSRSTRSTTAAAARSPVRPSRHTRRALADGSTIAYRKLLLATGASPVVPPIPGIDRVDYHVRTDDATRLRAAMPARSLRWCSAPAWSACTPPRTWSRPGPASPSSR